MARLGQARLVVAAITSSLALQLVTGGGCDWECSPITDCPMVFRDLVRAKIARQNENEELLNKVIRYL